MSVRLRLLLITLATLTGMGITASLGLWQLNRAAEKQALQAAMDAQGSQHPLDAAVLLGAGDASTLSFQHARLRGQWLADQTVYLDNRQMDARVGFFVVTPLRLADNAPLLLVQRGWVPRNFEARAQLPAITTPAGVVEVAGRIAPPPGKLFELGTPALTPIRQNLDLLQMQAQLHAPMLPVILVQEGAPSEGLLRDWPAPSLGVEKHYGYAFQWFGMCAVMALLYLWYQILKPRARRAKDSRPHAQ